MLLGFRRLDFLLFCQAQAILSGEGEAKEVDFHVNSRSDCTPFQGCVALFVLLRNFWNFCTVTHGTCSIFCTHFWEGITNIGTIHKGRPQNFLDFWPPPPLVRILARSRSLLCLLLGYPPPPPGADVLYVLPLAGSRNKHFYSPLDGCWLFTWRGPEVCANAG